MRRGFKARKSPNGIVHHSRLYPNGAVDLYRIDSLACQMLLAVVNLANTMMTRFRLC